MPDGASLRRSESWDEKGAGMTGRIKQMWKVGEGETGDSGYQHGTANGDQVVGMHLKPYSVLAEREQAVR